MHPLPHMHHVRYSPNHPKPATPRHPAHSRPTPLAEILSPTTSTSPSPTPSHDSSSINIFTHGLEGVDQTGNFLWVHVTVGFFLSLMAATFLLRMIRTANNHLRHVTLAGSKSRSQAFWSENQTWWWPKLKRHLLYSPLWSVRHNREIQLSRAVTIGTLPSRFHTLLLVAYLISNITYCLMLPWDRPNSASVIAAFRGRTGVLAALNLIPTVLFALRNNPLIWLLRVSYDTFNLLHRWAARLVIIESIAHTLAWGVNAYRDGGFQKISNQISFEGRQSFLWGTVALACFMFMGIQAWSPIRHAFYEVFLNIHRLCAAAAILGVYLHLKIANLPPLPWLNIVVGLWAAEWVIRFCRIAYFSIGRKRTTVTVEALPGDACRLTFTLARPWRVRPGCHVHAYIPALALWSSHPFSVAWTEGPQSIQTPDEKRDVELNLDTVTDQSLATNLSLVVRARTGMTRKLYDRASSSPNATFSTFGAIEGPYGGFESLHSYGTVIIFAGGVGITYAMTHMRDLVAGHASGKVAARKVLLVWSVPSTEALEWVRPWMDEVLRIPGRRDILRMHIFVTKPKSRAEVISGTGTIQMFPGRCNPQLVVDREIHEREGAVGITVCGPGAFSDSVRDAARKRVEVGCVDFIEEAFTY